MHELGQSLQAVQQKLLIGDPCPQMHFHHRVNFIVDVRWRSDIALIRGDIASAHLKQCWQEEYDAIVEIVVLKHALCLVSDDEVQCLSEDLSEHFHLRWFLLI